MKDCFIWKNKEISLEHKL